MQPLTLHIDGLHSFREPVDIDLAALGQHGLFGIFGPIGSGKSTILDAVTLALFGTVDRLTGRSRRGIVNHHRKRCEVRLRFRVDDGEWEVQRAYRADRDGIAQRIHSRLARLPTPGGVTGSGSLEVVADKEREVNQAIEDLLGLNATDFMRAVVLPQGRFMEFLHLQGSERRRMLQRIFRLEPFGDGLRSRVKQEAARVDASLERTRGELDGLGAADATTVDEARSAALSARDRAVEARTAFQKANDAADAARAAARFHQERNAAVRALEAHDTRAHAIRTLEAAITRARRLRPVATAHRRQALARTAVAQAEARVQTTSQALESASAALVEAQSEESEASRAIAEQAPGLRQRREGLVRAVRLLGDLEDAAQAVHKLSNRKGQLRRRQEDDERISDTRSEALQEIVARRTALRNAWADAQVSQGLRQRIAEATTAKTALDAARDRSAQLARTISDLSERQQDAEAALARARAAVRAGEDRMERTRSELTLLEAQQQALAPLSRAADTVRRQGLLERMGASSELSRVSADEVRNATSALDDARSRLAALEADPLQASKLAGVLAAQLAPGDPCAVCGSTEHPSPAHGTSADALLEAIEARAHAAAAVSSCEQARTAAQQRHHAAQRQLSELVTQIPDTLVQRSITSSAALLLFLEREERARRTLEHAVARGEHACRALQPGIDEARSLLDTAAARLAAIEDERARARAARDASLDAEGDAWGRMTEALGELTLFDLPRMRASIEEKDRTRDELEPRITAIDAELEAAQADWQKRQTRIASRHAELERLTAELEAADARRQSLLASVREAAPEGQPVERLAEVEEALEQLETRLRAAAAAVATARRAQANASTDAAAATEALRAARSEHDAASQALDAVLTEARLSEAEADAALADAEATLPGADLDARAAEVQQWLERRAALAHQLETIDARDAPTLSADQTEQALAEAEAGLAEAEAARRAADTERIRASERLAQLEARAERYTTLTQQAASLTDRADRLSELARLLRGDRFVEYVANDYLHDLAALATDHLAHLTRGRYALTLDESGAFLIADLDAGGAVRPASSLSGGETFITSLALALALSTQIQRHHAAALEFFFLDEGFGSLDPESLDRVMTAIESLSDGRRVIGLISHVGAVRERVPSSLVLECPRDGRGTQLTVHEA
jgi:exonuclease SbcC